MFAQRRGEQTSLFGPDWTVGTGAFACSKSTDHIYWERAINPQHILIPSDLSDLSLLPVERCPEMFDNRVVTLLSIVPSMPVVATTGAFGSPMDDPGLQARVEEARAKLDELSIGLRDSKDVRIEVIVGGDSGKETARWAQENGVDLIALSTHGRTGWRRLVLGSVAESILRHATMPVMVFPAKEPMDDD